MKPGTFDPDDDALLDRFDDAGQRMCPGCAEDADQAITVGDLIKALLAHDRAMGVWVTWEGITRHLNADHLYVLDGRLMIDGDENTSAPEVVKRHEANRLAALARARAPKAAP